MGGRGVRLAVKGNYTTGNSTILQLPIIAKRLVELASDFHTSSRELVLKLHTVGLVFKF